jgi:stearoyl-CoA desaturase (Delta-9 desaturase)
MIGMYVLTAQGITVGFHRFFTHRSFETYACVKVLLAAFGSMASQGSLFRWVAYHRRHLQHSNTSNVPILRTTPGMEFWVFYGDGRPT